MILVCNSGFHAYYTQQVLHAATCDVYKLVLGIITLLQECFVEIELQEQIVSATKSICFFYFIIGNILAFFFTHQRYIFFEPTPKKIYS